MAGPIAVRIRQEPGKIAVCWLELVLLLLVIFFGLGLWTAADRLVTRARRHERPVKEKYEHDSKAPMLRTALAMAQKELGTVQAKSIETNMEIARLSAELAAKTKTPPPPAQKADREQSLRDARIKLDTATAMSRDLEKQAGEKAASLARAGPAAFDAQHAADVAFAKATDEFDLDTKKRVIGCGVGAWTGLLLLTWPLCLYCKSRIGHCRYWFLAVPSLVVVASLSIYELVR